MAANSAIEWTHHTFNPWWGCAKVSPACDHCYAERDAHRFAPGKTYWGVDAERREFGDKHWNEPRQWNKKAAAVNADRAAHGLPPTPVRVFCASMADVFDKNAPAGARDRLWQLIKETPHLTWQILTKRIGNAKTMLPADWGDGYPNVWLIISVVTQEEINRDVIKLLRTPAAIRGLSMEPMLELVRLTEIPIPPNDLQPGYGTEHGFLFNALRNDDSRVFQAPAHLDWVIVGGESGPLARPMPPNAPRIIRNECAESGVPFLFKQWGEYSDFDHIGQAWNSLPEHVKANQKFIDGKAMIRIGKKAAGRLLDGVQHDGYPDADRTV